MAYLIHTMVFLPIICGFLPLAVKDYKKLNIACVAVCIFDFAACLYLLFAGSAVQGQLVSIGGFSGLGINFEINGLGILQRVATCVIWVGSSVFSHEYFDHDRTYLGRYYAFFMVTFGATLGIFLAWDLFTLFVFFEVMSFASYALVAHNQDQDSVAAGNSYLTIAVLGGLVMLLGIFLMYSMTGTLTISRLKDACGEFLLAADGSRRALFAAAGVMIFFGFAAKAGMFPLHGWLPKAHPAAPAPASAALSGILIKAGVYGAIVVTLKIFSGNMKWAMVMLAIGVLTMFVGAVFALLSINLKETLAYSSMSQIGFITIGLAMTSILGEHGSIAAYGTVLHMINHTLIKLVLFTSAGVVYMNTHSLDLNKVQGFGKGKPVLMVCFLTAALGIMGVPGFNGYISKTLLHEGIVEQIHLLHESAGLFKAVEAIFLISGGFTVAYMTKLFICLFVKKPNEQFHTHGSYMSKRTAAVLCAVSGVILAFGLFPAQTLDKIAAGCVSFLECHPLEEGISYFSFTNLKGALISISIGAVIYVALVKNVLINKTKGYINPYNKAWTIENKIFRPLLFTVLPFIGGFVCRIFDVAVDVFVFVVNRLFCKSVSVPATFLYGKPKEEHDSAVSITRSLSYSLLLFGVGLMVMLIYLLVSEFRV